MTYPFETKFCDLQYPKSVESTFARFCIMMLTANIQFIRWSARLFRCVDFKLALESQYPLAIVLLLHTTLVGPLSNVSYL